MAKWKLTRRSKDRKRTEEKTVKADGVYRDQRNEQIVFYKNHGAGKTPVSRQDYDDLVCYEEEK